MKKLRKNVYDATKKNINVLDDDEHLELNRWYNSKNWQKTNAPLDVFNEYHPEMQ